MKDNNACEALSIRLDPATRSLLEHRAKIQHLNLSKYLRQLINVGLEREREILAGNNLKYSRLEKILLKNSIETLMLIHTLINESDSQKVKEINEKSSLLVKQIIGEN